MFLSNIISEQCSIGNYIHALSIYSGPDGLKISNFEHHKLRKYVPEEFHFLINRSN